MDSVERWAPEGRGATAVRFAREPTALFVNTASRVGKERFDAVRRELEALGVPLVEASGIDDPGGIPERIRAAVRAGVRRLIVGGGDGSLSSAAKELAERDVVMGVIPLGTCNDFARSLHIPTDLRAACRVALSAEIREVDLGTAGDRFFLNAASIGLSTAVARRLSPDLKRKLGPLAMLVTATSQAWSHQPFGVTLEMDGVSQSFLAHQVVIGNGRYHGGGRMVGPSASLEDRRLDVSVIRSSRPARQQTRRHRWSRLEDLWTLLQVATLISRGRHVDHPAVVHHRLTRVRVTAEPKQEVDVDGELDGETPVDFAVRPGALKVAVPPDQSISRNTSQH